MNITGKGYKFSFGKKNPSYSHGMYGTPIYSSWSHIKDRCFNKKLKGYNDYGGRGIKVCNKWLLFSGFFEDMGSTYKKGKTIDRIDTNGDYNKENCKWSSRLEQSKNKRSTIFYELNGKKMCRKDWAKHLKISQSTLKDRIEKYHWPLKEALTILNLGWGKKRMTLAYQ